MPIIFQSRVSSKDLILNPKILYIFGDNDERRGRGGLAKECRDHSNAVGIRVKKRPKRSDAAYYTDAELENNKTNIEVDFLPVIDHLESGGIVVYPSGGIGNELAEMNIRCPKTFAYMNIIIDALVEKYNC